MSLSLIASPAKKGIRQREISTSPASRPSRTEGMKGLEEFIPHTNDYGLRPPGLG